MDAASVQPQQPHRPSHPQYNPSLHPDDSTALDHQTLLITSLLMGDGKTQRSRAEVMGIRFYSSRDVALGRFLSENCFQLTPRQGFSGIGGIMGRDKDNAMLDNVLSYVHRQGRIDITVQRASDAFGGSHPHSGAASTSVSERDRDRDRDRDRSSDSSDPLQTPIYMHSYCKECAAVVTPVAAMSDETWKISFGKFLEMCFYNRSARGRTGGCTHFVRDCHVLHFSCEGYVARFDFTPVHPYSLHVRSGMSFPGKLTSIDKDSTQ
jgi:1-phosphatidylinositol-3-phosphate 5-kinase